MKWFGLLLALSLIAPAKGVSQPLSADPWSVPSRIAVAPANLPERQELDITQPLDLTAAVLSAAARFDAVNRMEPNLEQLVLDLLLDPRAAFAHIRDTVANQPYDGHLRDAKAVLIAGTANPNDKAAALAEILARMGYDTRLVSAGTAVTTPLSMCRTAQPHNPEALKVAGFGPDLVQRVTARATASYLALHPVLDPQPTTDAAGPAHIWLQVRDGQQWVDLDPWTADAEWGDAPFPDATPLAEPATPHAVEIRVFAETLKDQNLRQLEVLSAAFEMPLAAEDWITLSFGPATGGIGGILSDTLGGLQGEAAPMRAVLSVNGDARTGRAFAAPGVPMADSGLFAEGVEEITTAVTLQIAVLVPGQDPQLTERRIIDLLPPAVRAAHAEGAPLTGEDLIVPTPGDRFPAAMESMRHIVISHGGLSQRLTAARTVRDLLTLPETARRIEAGQPDIEALLWTTWLQARRVALASEQFVRLRGAHEGSCAAVMQPQVMIWGLSNDGEDRVLQWLDWTVDRIGVWGGTPTTDAEMRLWHGAVQSALETEALLRATNAPGNHFPMDQAPMQPLTEAQITAAAPDTTADQDAGYLTLADAATPDGYWWRVDPVHGRADARARVFGNTRYFNPWSNYVSASRGGIVHISEAELVRLEADLARLGPQGFADEMARLEDLRQAERSRQKGGGGNEYVIIINNVSIPISIAAGVVVGTIVIGGLSIALYGE